MPFGPIEPETKFADGVVGREVSGECKGVIEVEPWLPPSAVGEAEHSVSQQYER